MHNLKRRDSFMKTIYSFAHQMLVGSLALALTSLATVATAENIPQVVTVLKMHGSARYSTDNKVWQPVKVGLILPVGSVIQTAEDSTVDIVMAPPGFSTSAGLTTVNMPANVSQQFGATGAAGDPATAESGAKGNVVHIFPSSVLAIDKVVVEKTGVDEVDETQLDLRAGQIMGNVKKLSAASRYEIKLPNGVAGIRGTTYVVNATGAIMVLSGQVIVSYIAGNGQMVTQIVNAGQSFNPFLDSNGNPVPVASANPEPPQPIPPATLAALNNIPIPVDPPTPVTYTKGPVNNQTIVLISPTE